MGVFRVVPPLLRIDLGHGESAKSGAFVLHSSAVRRLANTMILHTVQNSMPRTEQQKRSFVRGLSVCLGLCCTVVIYDSFLNCVCTARSSHKGGHQQELLQKRRFE